MFKFLYRYFGGRTKKDIERYKRYVDSKYTEARTSELMNGIRLVLTENSQYLIKGVKSDKKPIAPSFLGTFYNETKAKEAYISIYGRKIMEVKDKSFKEVL